MMRIAQPHERREEGVIAQLLLGAPDDFAEQKAVGEERHVMPVLLMRGNGDDHGSILAKGSDVRPLEVGEFHRRQTNGCQLPCKT